MSRMRLKRVGVMTVAIWQTLTATLFGLLFGIVLGMFSLASFGLKYGFIYILRWVVYTPIVFGLIGFLVSVAGASIYNLLVRKRGGVVLVFEDIKADIQSTPPPPSTF